MRKVRCLYFLMSLFSLISLICIGFSSWTISGTGAEVMGTGGITASPVYDVDEYAFTSADMQTFQFNETKFLSSGFDTFDYVTVTYTVNFKKAADDGKKVVIYFRGVSQNETAIDLHNNQDFLLAGYTLYYDKEIDTVHDNADIYVQYFSGIYPSDKENIVTGDANTDFSANKTMHYLVLPMPTAFSQENKDGVLVRIRYRIQCVSGNFAGAYAILASTEKDGEGNPKSIATFYSHARIE